jgi:hypothetical protein
VSPPYSRRRLLAVAAGGAALAALGARDAVEPFPVAVGLERASAALDRYLG